jgi:Domain of unknown function (DU1801)
MSEIKTKQNDASVAAFIAAIQDAGKKSDCETVLKIMQQVTKEEPKMWGASIVGFGSYQYQSAKTKRGGDWFIMGFSPRKQHLALYIMPGVEHYKEIVKKLGKCKTSVSCLYITELAGIDLAVLQELLHTAYKKMKALNNKTA